MHVIRNSNYNKHDVHWKYTVGPESYETRDTPKRVDVITAALQSDKSIEFHDGHEFPEADLSRMHPYHDFIRHVSEQVKDKSDEVYLDLFPGPGARLQRKVHMLWGGMWCTDTITPISQHTYEVARGSAEVAMTATELVLGGKQTEAYALCRPSGHHAGPRVFGDYCYFNNTVMAAEMFSRKGKTAVLDIDYHHGNGTQEYFEERTDVFTANIHADPDFEYPYFWGDADEIGIGQGEGTKLNLPMPKQTSNDEYLGALRKAINAMQEFGAEHLVISAGFDTHADDPIGGFKVTTDAYRQIGAELAQMGLPTVISQEGGYNTEVLGQSVLNFLQGFRDARK